MLTSKSNILQLVTLMHAHGITDVVLCPGSRNAPICHTISQTGLFTCHAITDERSAGFFAIGLALATDKTVAVCVTSGSALLNVHPAVAEAYYQQVPLLVISADRPAEWIGQMDGQTMPQPDAFGKMVKTCVNLPEAHTAEEQWHCNRLINEALLETTHRTMGPVHINVPISEPLYNFPTTHLPQERIIQRIEGLYPAQLDTIRHLLSKSQRPMIIVGQHTPQHLLASTEAKALCQGFAVLCEHLANPGSAPVIRITDALMDKAEQADTLMDKAEQNIDPANKPEQANALTNKPEQADACPDLVITLGGHIVNKRLKQFLRKHQPAQHWHVSADGQVADLFQCLTTVVEAQPAAFLQALVGIYNQAPASKALTHPCSEPKAFAHPCSEPKALTHPCSEPKAFAHLWNELSHTSVPLAPCPEQACVESLLSQLPPDAVLHLANSSSVRYAQHYPLRAGITVCCNRGINGIEGSLSSAVGYAVATPERPNFVIIGDLSFFYDQNALWNRSLPHNLHILLLNNGGGKIFQTLPVPDDPASRSIICAHHSTTAHSVAQQYGIRYFEGTKNMGAFITSDETALLECIF